MIASLLCKMLKHLYTELEQPHTSPAPRQTPLKLKHGRSHTKLNLSQPRHTLHTKTDNQDDKASPHLQLPQEDVHILAVLTHEVTDVPFDISHTVQHSIVVYCLSSHSSIDMVPYLKGRDEEPELRSMQSIIRLKSLG